MSSILNIVWNSHYEPNKLVQYITLFFFCLLSTLHGQAASNSHKLDTFPLSCFAVNNSFCIDQGSHMITLPASPSALIASWSFDFLFTVDDSGNGNHFHPGVFPGPPVMANGASAHLHSSLPLSKSTIDIPEKLDPSFSLTFWIYSLKDSLSTSPKTFLTQDHWFSLALSSADHHLVVTIGDTKLVSQASLLPRRWTFIAVTVASQKNATLYWNAIQDIRHPIAALPTKKTTELSLGFSNEKDSIELYLDDLRLYQGELNKDMIEAHTLPSLTGISNSQAIRLGCLDCTLDDVLSSTFCKDMYQLCSKQEYLRYGFRLARIQGYIEPNQTKVWYKEELSSISRDPLVKNQHGDSERRLALCCSISLGCMTM